MADQRQSGAKSWKNGAKVPSSASAMRIPATMAIRPRSTLRARSKAVSPSQLAKKATTAQIVLPANGPTRSEYASEFAKLSLASATTTRIARTSAPIPVASNAAATGPLGRPSTSEAARCAPAAARSRSAGLAASISNLPRLADGCLLGDQGAEQSGDHGNGERADKEAHRDPPGEHVADQIGAVVEDHERR